MTDPVLLSERVKTSIALGESHFREFKSAYEGPPGQKTLRAKKDIADDICRTLVGFANADGGELLVGVEDDGDVTGLGGATDKVRQYLQECWKDGVHKDTPLRDVRVSQLTIDTNDVLYFMIGKSVSQIHLTADGRCLQRKDLETAPTAYDEIQFNRQEQKSRGYDREYVTGSSVEDLDIPAVRVLAEHVSSGMTPEKCLQYLGLADFTYAGLQLTRAALILFSREVWKWHPRSHVRILKVTGTELKTGSSYNVATDTPIQGNILFLIEETWKTLRPHLTQTRLSGSGRFEASIMYPEAACREALINAVAHRDYSQEGRGIEIYVFDDRIEFISPGGLISSLSVADLRKLEGAHQSRNTLIARALREIGYMREVGEGIRRMFELMSDSELEPPRISADNTAFSVTLSNSLMYSREHILWIDQFAGISLNKDEKAVIVLGYGDKHFSANDVIKTVGIVDIEEFRKLMESLRRKGILQQTMEREAAYAVSRRKKIPRRDVPRWRIGVPAPASHPKSVKPVERRTRSVSPKPLTKETAGHRIFVGNISRNIDEQEFELLVSAEPTEAIIEWPPLYSDIGPKYCILHVRTRSDADRLQKSLSSKEIDGLRLIARIAASV